MSKVHATAGKVQSDPYVFLSDIWNGYGGDGGWWGCGARNNPNSGCQYAIKNIQVHTNTGTPMFSGHCAPLNADHVGPAPPPPPPPSPTPSGWTEHPDLNCFDGHGAQVVDGDDPTHPFSTSMTVSQCEASCDAKSDCTAIVVPSNGAPQCFRRKNAVISKCLADQGYNLYTRGAGPSPPAPTPAGWHETDQLNCYPGRGGDACDGDDPANPYSWNMTVAQCQAACLGKSDCTGIIVPSNGAKQCFRRKNIVVSQCLANPAYDLFTRTSSDADVVV